MNQLLKNSLSELNTKYLINKKMKKKSINPNFREARVSKKDEFYTQLTDIERELKNYTFQRTNEVKKENNSPLVFDDDAIVVEL